MLFQHSKDFLFNEKFELYKVHSIVIFSEFLLHKVYGDFQGLDPKLGPKKFGFATTESDPYTYGVLIFFY